MTAARGTVPSLAAVASRGGHPPAKLDAPVENEVFFNVGALRAQLTAMQAKIDTLEKALAAMRAPAPK